MYTFAVGNLQKFVSLLLILRDAGFVCMCGFDMTCSLGARMSHRWMCEIKISHILSERKLLQIIFMCVICAETPPNFVVLSSLGCHYSPELGAR